MIVIYSLLLLGNYVAMGASNVHKSSNNNRMEIDLLARNIKNNVRVLLKQLAESAKEKFIKGDLTGAVADAQKILTAIMPNDDNTVDVQATALLIMGQYYLSQKGAENQKKAVESFRKVIQLTEKNNVNDWAYTQAHAVLGEIVLCHTAGFSEATHHFEKVLARTWGGQNDFARGNAMYQLAYIAMQAPNAPKKSYKKVRDYLRQIAELSIPSAAMAAGLLANELSDKLAQLGRDKLIKRKFKGAWADAQAIILATPSTR